MFNFILKKNLEVFAPCTGKLMDITQVTDPVFADKTMGDGFAVEPDSDTITAPFDGTITFLPRTTHALVIENNGVQLLIHIGLDTVELHGEGFTALIHEGDIVRQGTPLIKFDRQLIQSRQKSLTTIVALCNQADVVAALEKDLSGRGPILKITRI
jgi:glucose-specific phosphotransferase system IIA component